MFEATAAQVEIVSYLLLSIPAFLFYYGSKRLSRTFVYKLLVYLYTQLKNGEAVDAQLISWSGYLP